MDSREIETESMISSIGETCPIEVQFFDGDIDAAEVKELQKNCDCHICTSHRH